MARGVEIQVVHEGTIAEDVGIETGDRVIAINGENVNDILDYRYLVTDAKLEILIGKRDGEQWLVDIEKEAGYDLGIELEGFGKIRQCANKCLFCFVDQMPGDMRDSLYVKDDDYRHSFLYGNFITLTNVSRFQLERIAKFRLSPLYISVHTTNPALREQMLCSKTAGEIMKQLQYLADHKISMHTQVVLCPGVNDDTELIRTIEDLARLWPHVKSLAVVPVGLTQHRQDLPAIMEVTSEKARAVIDIIEDKQHYYLKKYGSRFVFSSDEFYLKARRKIPTRESYESFPQTENGVGLTRLFLDSWKEAINQELSMVDDKPFYVGTGYSMAPVMRFMLVDIVKKFPEAHLKVVTLDNHFFGRSVTVTGLITGQDVIKNMTQKLTPNERQEGTLLLPSIMLKEDDNIFLDGLTVAEVSEQLEMEVKLVETDPHALLKALGFQSGH